MLRWGNTLKGITLSIAVGDTITIYLFSAASEHLKGYQIRKGDFVIVTHTRDRFLSFVTKVERKGGIRQHI